MEARTAPSESNPEEPPPRLAFAPSAEPPACCSRRTSSQSLHAYVPLMMPEEAATRVQAVTRGKFARATLSQLLLQQEQTYGTLRHRLSYIPLVQPNAVDLMQLCAMKIQSVWRHTLERRAVDRIESNSLLLIGQLEATLAENAQLAEAVVDLHSHLEATTTQLEEIESSRLAAAAMAVEAARRAKTCATGSSPSRPRASSSSAGEAAEREVGRLQAQLNEATAQLASANRQLEEIEASRRAAAAAAVEAARKAKAEGRAIPTPPVSRQTSLMKGGGGMADGAAHMAPRTSLPASEKEGASVELRAGESMRDEVAALRGEVAALRAQLKAATEEAEAARAEATAAADCRATHAQELEAAVSVAKADGMTSLMAAREEHAAEVLAAREDGISAVQAAKERFAAELAAAVNKERADAMAALQASKEEHSVEVESAVAVARAESMSAVEAARREHAEMLESAVAKATADGVAAVEAAREQFIAELESAVAKERADGMSALKAAREEHAAEVESVSNKVREESQKALEAATKELVSDWESAVAKARADGMAALEAAELHAAGAIEAAMIRVKELEAALATAREDGEALVAAAQMESTDQLGAAMARANAERIAAVAASQAEAAEALEDERTKSQAQMRAAIDAVRAEGQAALQAVSAEAMELEAAVFIGGRASPKLGAGRPPSGALKMSRTELLGEVKGTGAANDRSDSTEDWEDWEEDYEIDDVPMAVPHGDGEEGSQSCDAAVLSLESKELASLENVLIQSSLREVGLQVELASALEEATTTVITAKAKEAELRGQLEAALVAQSELGAELAKVTCHYDESCLEAARAESEGRAAANTEREALARALQEKTLEAEAACAEVQSAKAALEAAQAEVLITKTEAEAQVAKSKEEGTALKRRVLEKIKLIRAEERVTQSVLQQELTESDYALSNLISSTL